MRLAPAALGLGGHLAQAAEVIPSSAPVSLIGFCYNTGVSKTYARRQTFAVCQPVDLPGGAAILRAAVTSALIERRRNPFSVPRKTALSAATAARRGAPVAALACFIRTDK